MAQITVAQLIKSLQTKDQDQPVEFIVVTDKGAVVVMNLEMQAKDIAKVCKLMG